MIRFILLALLLQLTIIAFSQTNEVKLGIEMSPSDFHEAMTYRKDVITIDIQSATDRTIGKFEPSIWINPKTTDVKQYIIDNFKKEDVLFIYDHDGVQAKKLADELAKLDFKYAFYMVGGYKAYKAEN